MAVTLTKEQASLLLPLLPNLAGLIASQTSSKTATTANSDQCTPPELYSISDMFSKKKKNSCSTAAQNYLLAIVRTSAKAANIWEEPPLLKNITAAQFAKFFDTAFLMCPKLKSCRQQLTTRLSRTLINRRLYLHRLRKKGMPIMPIQVNGSDQQLSTEIQKGREDKGSESIAAAVSDLNSEEMHTSQSDNSHHRPVSGNTVTVAKADGTHVGKGVFLKMNSEEPIEQFAKVLFLSAKRSSKMEELDVELPSMSEHGKFNFNELEKGDIFVWKLSRLLPVDSCKPSQVLQQNKSTSRSSFKVGCSTSSTSDSEDSISDTDQDVELSALEQKRLKNIERLNQKKREIFGEEFFSTKKSSKKVPVKRKKHSDDHVETNTAKRFKKLEQSEALPRPSNEPVLDVVIGEYRAVKCKKYHDRPLIGCITKICDETAAVEIDWMVGSYSGIWKAWRGRANGKTVRFTDKIPFSDVMTKVEFTKGMRIPPKSVIALKELYAKI